SAASTVPRSCLGPLAHTFTVWAGQSPSLPGASREDPAQVASSTSLRAAKGKTTEEPLRRRAASIRLTLLQEQRGAVGLVHLLEERQQLRGVLGRGNATRAQEHPPLELQAIGAAP